ncbi:hypothetical protein Fmac_028275 [Flemingia macrophylla]|uniref:Uncharacterized protein n=1 Tax=Flemingia macrophylla TaxID=520843 RepID=A0ABD1L729_9FABA
MQTRKSWKRLRTRAFKSPSCSQTNSCATSPPTKHSQIDGFDLTSFPSTHKRSSDSSSSATNSSPPQVHLSTT